MVILVSSQKPDRMILGALCSERGWPTVECDSLRILKRHLLRVQPSVLVVRHELEDGYSDDAIGLVTEPAPAWPVRVIVLAGAGLSSANEARQINLGADVIHRDPIRVEVVLAQIARFRTLRYNARAKQVAAAVKKPVPFAGGLVDLLDRTLSHAGKVVELTSREADLVRVLIESGNQVATYELLYNDILGRQFRGDTSNMRVLLGKLDNSCGAVDLNLRSAVDVIPKSGYRYRTSAFS